VIDDKCSRRGIKEIAAQEGSQCGILHEKEESSTGNGKDCVNVIGLGNNKKHLELTECEAASIEALRDIGSPAIALEALQLFAMIGNRMLLEQAVLYLKKILEEERLKH